MQKDLWYLTSSLHDPIREEENAGMHNGCKYDFYGEHDQDMLCMHGNDNAMQVIEIKRNQNPGQAN
jgi:hypothetical protein